MKKEKIFLWFLIPFLSLSAISVMYFILNTTNGLMYFKSMISDPFFIIALVNTFVPSLIISSIIVLIYKIALRFLFRKIVVNRKRNYIFIFLISLIAPVVYIIIMTRAFDLINNTIFTLQIGMIVTFVFWVVDTVKEKNKKG